MMFIHDSWKQAKHRKRKLCIITPTHWSSMMGGAEYQMRCLIDYLLDAQTFEIHYLARNMSTEFTAARYQTHKIGDGNGIRRFGYFFDSYDLLRLLKRIGPDAILQHDGGAYTGIAAFYAAHHRCNMVWHVASDDELLPYRRGHSLTNIVDKKMLEYGIRHSPRVTVQTHRQAELLWHHYGREADAVIPNFHPFPREAGTKSGPVKVLWVANFKPLKQPEVFLRLAGDLSRLGYEVQCIMVGAPASWAPQWQRSLELQIARLSNCTYLGALPIEKVNELFVCSDIFVNTSRIEGFPNTFIQAWMRKVPVVSLNIDPDGILSRYNIGHVCGTYDNLLKVIINLINNRNEIDIIGKRAFEYAKKVHSMNNVSRFLEYL